MILLSWLTHLRRTVLSRRHSSRSRRPHRRRERTSIPALVERLEDRTLLTNVWIDTSDPIAGEDAAGEIGTFTIYRDG
ncbi:MAG: hypothetical protein ACREJB_07520, partial [Planctomycetaceae bacterium]